MILGQTLRNTAPIPGLLTLRAASSLVLVSGPRSRLRSIRVWLRKATLSRRGRTSTSFITLPGVSRSTDGSAILAGRRRNDAHRHPHRLPRDQQRPIGVVRRRARTDGLPDFRPDALFVATRCPLTVSYG